MSDVIINDEVLIADSQDVWQNASTRALEVRDAVPDIATPDFSLVFGAASTSAAYAKVMEALGKYLEGGSTEFLHFEKRLLESVIVYGEAHGMTAQEIAELEAEIDV